MIISPIQYILHLVSGETLSILLLNAGSSFTVSFTGLSSSSVPGPLEEQKVTQNVNTTRPRHLITRGPQNPDTSIPGLCWRKSSRGCDHQVNSKINLGNQKLFIPSSVLGIYTLPTAATVGTLSRTVALGE